MCKLIQLAQNGQYHTNIRVDLDLQKPNNNTCDVPHERERELIMHWNRIGISDSHQYI